MTRWETLFGALQPEFMHVLEIVSGTSQQTGATLVLSFRSKFCCPPPLLFPPSQGEVRGHWCVCV